MRIHQMHVTPIAISDPPLLNAAGLHAPYALRTVVELVTDDGISGVSEIPGNVKTNEALESIRDRVIGRDPFQLRSISAAIAEGGDRTDGGTAAGGPDSRGASPWDRRTMVHVQSAIDVACHDIMGKAIGRPVVDLLGGAVRDRVPFAAYLFYKEEGAGGTFGLDIDPAAEGWAAARQRRAHTPDEIVEQARAMCLEFGFKSIKLKGGAFPPDQEANAILALRKAFGPDVPLRLDPNAIWELDTAVRIGLRLQGVLEYFEDPVRGQEAMAALRRKIDIPLATNMCTTSFDDLPSAVALGSEDIILSDHHFWGGLLPSVELGRICTTFGRGLSMHSNSHVGISLAAMTHLAAAVPSLSYAVDTHYPWQSEEIVVGGRMQFEDGSLAVSREPGLGVELDRDALERLHRNYLACGLTERNDEVELQKIRPGWGFEPTRW